ncbi:hypothetical protein EYF80_031139 [Liparis tanakae]|uniref:Uncharacterized protein n=1 Tax=Liparis tanakae TaxID=230148 RepID=A0A4Z2GYN0_9TELE|nr:hypothetical protein EYF80_031139 [Liparis tanakae]
MLRDAPSKGLEPRHRGPQRPALLPGESSYGRVYPGSDRSRSQLTWTLVVVARSGLVWSGRRLGLRRGGLAVPAYMPTLKACSSRWKCWVGSDKTRLESRQGCQTRPRPRDTSLTRLCTGSPSMLTDWSGSNGRLGFRTLRSSELSTSRAMMYTRRLALTRICGRIGGPFQRFEFQRGAVEQQREAMQRRPLRRRQQSAELRCQISEIHSQRIQIR